MHRLAVVLAVTCACLGGSVAGASRFVTTFTDPAEDSDDAPDVTTVTVSDTAAGVVEFRIGLGPPGAVPSGTTVTLALDTDGDPSTGAASDFGVEYLVELTGGSPATLTLTQWKDGEFAEVPRQSTTASLAGGVLTFTMRVSELGIGPRLNFWIQTVTADGSSVDNAPDQETWSYQRVNIPTAPKVAVRSVLVRQAGAAAPRAGKRFTVAVTVRLTDGKVVKPTTHACAARIGRSPVRAAAKCAWRLPAKSAGKLLLVTVTGTYAKLPFKGQASFRIRA